ncbi:hypothetical protein V8C86DRAFT_1228689 [Haematococcus lacustris]
MTDRAGRVVIGATSPESESSFWEPQLKYDLLSGSVPDIVSEHLVTCLCLSDKILALGTEHGSIHVLDYSGNEVRRLQPHSSRVHALSFDGEGEVLASGSEEGVVAVTSLYSESASRQDFKRPIKTLALDPRYSSRSSKQLVTAGGSGPVVLSSQGWLGRSDTVLASEPEVQVVRWWSHFIAWVTHKAAMVYCTHQHRAIRALARPPKGAFPDQRCASLLFGLNGCLYVSWPDCIKVARTYVMENNIGAPQSGIEVLAELKLDCLVLGVSPFGSDLAVLTYPTSTLGASAAATPTAPPPDAEQASAALATTAAPSPAPAPAPTAGGVEAQEKAAPTVRVVEPGLQPQLVQGYIHDLLTRGAYEEAAALSPRLLRTSISLWERWVYLFAQARQLAKLAPVLPTEAPRLRTPVYDMVLTALLANPSDHPLLLKLVRSWPPGLFSAPALVDAVVARMKRSGTEGADSQELWRLLALLYESQGHHEGLLAGLMGPGAAQLLDINEEAGIRLLVRHMDLVTCGHVVAALQEAVLEASGSGSEAGGRWRRALWRYLAAVFEVDPAASAEFHELQVRLTADYAPHRLLPLLAASQHVPLEAALAICEERGLVAEQVFILGRMGNASHALHLIIEKLGDIPQAIEFVRGQRDQELWEHLMAWALSSPDTTGALLDHIGGEINPLALLRRLPPGMAIPRLRDRIRTIITDFRTQTSLREGCNVILRSDCTHLISRLHRAAAAHVASVWVCAPSLPGQTPTMPGAAVSGAWYRLERNTGLLLPLAAPPTDLPAEAVQVAVGGEDSPGAAGAGRGAGWGPGGTAAGRQRVWVGCHIRPTVQEARPGSGQQGYGGRNSPSPDRAKMPRSTSHAAPGGGAWQPAAYRGKSNVEGRSSSTASLATLIST